MHLFKFEDFIFDATSHKLSYKGKKVDIRPKALKLLSLLIVNRHKVLSKSEIISSIWGSDYARDHLLFQLISELRKHPLKNEFVRTLPNEGYKWNVKTKIIKSTTYLPKVMAASFAAAIMGVSVFALPYYSSINTNVASTKQLPAYSALTKGIIALEKGETENAVEWFKFALLENPDSVESSIFLAETLYQQNQFDESSIYLHQVLNNTESSHYDKASASIILSRISEQQGEFGDALKHVQKSSEANELGQCSADYVVQRLQVLESKIAMSPAISTNDQLLINEKANEPNTEIYLRQCNELNKTSIETSWCIPLYEDIVAGTNSVFTARIEVG